MEKRLFEYFKDSFRLGAAVGGILYDYEGAVKKHEKFLEFIKTHPKPEGIPDFKIPPLPKGPFIESDILAKHFNLVVAENDTKMCNVFPSPNEYDFSSADKFLFTIIW